MSSVSQRLSAKQGKRGNGKLDALLKAQRAGSTGKGNTGKGNAGEDTKRKKPKASPATLLAERAFKYGIRVFRTPRGEAYADLYFNENVRRETYAIGSAEFKDLLQMIHYVNTKGACPDKVLNDVISQLRSEARFGAKPIRRVYIRAARIEGTEIVNWEKPEEASIRLKREVWIDCGTDNWSAIKVTAEGWSYVQKHNVNQAHLDETGIRFRRTAETGELPLVPLPQLGLPSATNEDMARYFGLTGDELMLVIAAVVFALAGRGTYPIVCVHGSHGSGKTVMLRRIMKLIDPQVDDKGRDISLWKLPKTEEDLYVAVNSRHASAFDNVSGVPLDISDAIMYDRFG